MASGGRDGGRPRVLVCQETHFHRMLLSEIVAEADCEPLVPLGRSLAEIARSGDRPPDLILVPLPRSGGGMLGELALLRRIESWAAVPALGITSLAGSEIDRDSLRELGVVGAIDKTAIPEHVIFRINRVVRPYASGRRNPRAPAFFPVDVDAAGSSATEYALNLSIGGMGLTSTRWLDRNTEISIRFWLPELEGLIELPARVIYCRSSQRRYAPFEMGVFFYPPSPDVLACLEKEVSRLLALTEGADAELPLRDYR